VKKTKSWYEKKRMYVLAVVMFYVISKIFVVYTKNPNDDSIPDTTINLLTELMSIK